MKKRHYRQIIAMLVEQSDRYYDCYKVELDSKKVWRDECAALEKELDTLKLEMKFERGEG